MTLAAWIFVDFLISCIIALVLARYLRANSKRYPVVTLRSAPANDVIDWPRLVHRKNNDHQRTIAAVEAYAQELDLSGRVDIAAELRRRVSASLPKSEVA